MRPDGTWALLSLQGQTNSCHANAGLLRPHVVTKQHVLVADIELAFENDRVRPAFAEFAGEAEGTFEFVALRRGFDERHRGVLVTEIEMAVGVHNRRRPGTWAALLAPDDFAGEELDAGRKTVVMAVAHVNVVAEKNHAPVVILELVRRKIINLFCLYPVASLRKFEQRAASVTVAAGTEDIVAFDQRRGDVGCAVGDL